jgi:hypothetical protein
MHIPKTAGMAVRQALASQYPLEEKLPAETWDQLTSEPVPLSKYLLFVGHFRYFFRDVLPAATYSFTFLRDPARRTFSHLNHILADPEFGDDHILARQRDIRSLLEDPRFIARCSNTQVAYLSKPLIPLTEARLREGTAREITLVGDADLESAIENLKKLSFIGFYDDLQADFARVCDDLGLHPPPTLLVKNSAQERNQAADISAEVMEMLRDVNALDYQLMDQALKNQTVKGAVQSREVRCRDLVERGIYHIINDPVEFRMSDPLPAVGVWQQEDMNGMPFRWTGPGRSLTFELPLDPALNYKFELSLASPNSIGSLAAYVDGVSSCIELKMMDGPVATVEIAVIPAPNKHITEIELRYERTFRPNADDRQLGFVISKAAIRPEQSS